jgi:eukaryotic-like serine/threonine-protein kinase
MEQQILNYQIERLLGEGGMSRVYLGIDLKTGQKVAIKELLAHLANHDELRERFRREAQFMAKLSHQHIVRLIRYEEIGTRLFLVQEYIEGVTLEEYIAKEKGPIPEDEAKELFGQLLETFAYAHDNEVIHRDIKPSNILITKGKQVKVVDFGIAKIAVGNSGGLHTKTGIRMGTLAYMSPEQVNGREVDDRTDIYSLGVLLYQMLTGKAPYDLETESEFEVQVKIVKEPLPRMKSTYEYVSDKMQRIVDKATAKEKGDRYRNCHDFMRAIHAPAPPQPRPNPPPVEDLKIVLSMLAWIVAILLLVALGVSSQSKHEAPIEAPVEAPFEAPAAPAAEYPAEAPEAPAAPAEAPAEYPASAPARPESVPEKPSNINVPTF